MKVLPMNTSRKAMEWLICFLIVNLMLGCLLFKKSKKFNKSCSLSKAARMSSTHLKYKLGLLRLYSLSHLDSSTKLATSYSLYLRRNSSFLILQIQSSTIVVLHKHLTFSGVTSLLKRGCHF